MSEAVCSFVVACNSVFLLYRRGRWELLKELKFSRDNEDSLRRFDMEQIVSDKGTIRSVQQTVKLLNYCPSVFPAAAIALGKFRLRQQIDLDFLQQTKQYLREYGWKGHTL